MAMIQLRSPAMGISAAVLRGHQYSGFASFRDCPRYRQKTADPHPAANKFQKTPDHQYILLFVSLMKSYFAERE